MKNATNSSATNSNRTCKTNDHPTDEATGSLKRKYMYTLEKVKRMLIKQHLNNNSRNCSTLLSPDIIICQVSDSKQLNDLLLHRLAFNLYILKPTLLLVGLSSCWTLSQQCSVPEPPDHPVPKSPCLRRHLFAS